MEFIEIILLIFLTRKIGVLAIQKGQKPLKWKLYTIAAWIIAESIGGMFAMNSLGINIQDIKGFKDYLHILPKNLFMISLIGLFFAFGGYLLVRAILEKKPDYINKNIDRINADELMPPKNQ